jgi:hypothetical protein
MSIYLYIRPYFGGVINITPFYRDFMVIIVLQVVEN